MPTQAEMNAMLAVPRIAQGLDRLIEIMARPEAPSRVYTSQETELQTDITCRFCEKFWNEKRPAVALRGQWEGGDFDIDPHWVPVCQKHLDDWDKDYETGDRLPERYQLATFYFKEGLR